MLLNGGDNVGNSTRYSVIKVAQSCCLEINANMEYEAKIKHEIKLTLMFNVK